MIVTPADLAPLIARGGVYAELSALQNQEPAMSAAGALIS